MPANVTSLEDASLSNTALNQFTASPDEQAQMRHNAALPNDSWQAIDDTIYSTEEQVDSILSDLRNEGLEMNTSVYAKDVVWEKFDDAGEARVAMDPQTRVEESTGSYQRDGVPLPLVMDKFTLGFRDRPAPDNPYVTAEDIDTAGVAAATRHVRMKLNELVMNGHAAFQGGDGYDLWGLTNHPSNNTGTLSDWTAVRDGTAPEPTPRQDVRNMIESVKAAGFYPGNTGYWLYVSRDYDSELNDFPNDQTDDMVRDRIMNLSEIDRIGVSDNLPAQSAVLFRPTSDVIDIAVAEEVQNVQWESLDGFSETNLILASMTPRVKDTVGGNTGIAFYQT